MQPMWELGSGFGVSVRVGYVVMGGMGCRVRSCWQQGCGTRSCYFELFERSQLERSTRNAVFIKVSA